MKLKLLLILSFAIFCMQLPAQNFTGFVKKDDSIGAPIYQASIQVIQTGHNFATIKTYFDGSFNFVPLKNEAYTFKISCPGYLDTSFSIITNRKGEPTPATAIIRLKKDGMRLLGVVKSAADSFPLKNVTVVLKNIMTRKEDRQTTGVDGQYNFKLEYETNYRIGIDKRSPGVFNKYRDTAFYVSTIGFNQPLDYPLDIILTPDANLNEQMPEGYDASKVTGPQNLKPVISISGNRRATMAVAANRHTSKPATAPRVTQQQSTAANSTAPAQVNRVRAFPVAVAVKVPQVINKPVADSAMQKHLALKAKAQQDSVNKITLVQRQKFLKDSIAEVGAENKRIAQQVVADRLRRDSITKLSAEKEK